MSSDSSPFWERLTLAVASTVLAAAVCGIWISVGSMGRTQAVIKSQLKDVRAAVQGVYTQRDADRDFAAVFRTDQDQYQQLKDLKNQVRALGKR